MVDHITTESVAQAMVADTATATAATISLAISVPPSTEDKGDERQRTVELLEINQVDTNVRTKLRTYLIVAALYSVLFIAALDQTIIA